MTHHTKIAAEPEILRLYRGMTDIDRHKVLQLLIREFEPAEDEADLFLARAASKLLPGNETAQDRLYPFGRLNMEASRRHRLMLERDILAAERAVNGRAAMSIAREPIADPRFFGDRFGG